MQAKRDTILNVGLHTLEDLSSRLDSQDNRTETWSQEDDIGSGLSGFRSTLNGNTAISLLQAWSVIDT